MFLWQSYFFFVKWEYAPTIAPTTAPVAGPTSGTGTAITAPTAAAAALSFTKSLDAIDFAASITDSAANFDKSMLFYVRIFRSS